MTNQRNPRKKIPLCTIPRLEDTLLNAIEPTNTRSKKTVFNTKSTRNSAKTILTATPNEKEIPVRFAKTEWALSSK